MANEDAGSPIHACYEVPKLDNRDVYLDVGFGRPRLVFGGLTKLSSERRSFKYTCPLVGLHGLVGSPVLSLIYSEVNDGMYARRTLSGGMVIRSTDHLSDSDVRRKAELSRNDWRLVERLVMDPKIKRLDEEALEFLKRAERNWTGGLVQNP